jgi:transposase InsO family protein
MHQQQHYPVRLLCDTLNVPVSSFYYQPKLPTDQSLPALRATIEVKAAEQPTYGYRRIHALLRREGTAVNRKRVQRLMQEMALQVKQTRLRPRTTNSQHGLPRYPNRVQNRTITQPDEVWVADLTYIFLERETVYLAVLMDVFTRCIRGWYLSRSLDRHLTLTALKRALATHCPHIHHSDQGVQYAATDYVALLQEHGVLVSMAQVGEPTQNGHAERLIRTLKEEAIALTEYRDFTDAYARIGQFIEEVYNHKRIHSALGYLTPAEFEQHWHLAQATASHK